MTDKIRKILDAIYKYNSTGSLASVNFGLDDTLAYDALVAAPSYTPYKLLRDGSWEIAETAPQRGFRVEKDGVKLAWIKTAVGGCNMLDYLLLCGELRFRRLIFIGAAGALREGFELGDICTPTFSVAGTLANTYLKYSIRDYVPFERVYPDREYTARVIELARREGHRIREASVFCTDSIAMEYSHLDEIRSFGTDLIEMETSVFYAVARLMEIPAVALLVVSDNSATGAPLVGRSDKAQEIYDRARRVVLPELILKIAES